MGLRLVLRETASTKAGRGRNTCFTAGRCCVRLDVCGLAEGRARRLNDGRTSRRLLNERALAERGLPRGSMGWQPRKASDSTRRLRGSRGRALNPGACEVRAVETGRGPSASDGALGPDAVSGLGGQHRVNHRIVDCGLGTRSLRAFGIAAVGVGGSSDGSLLMTLILDGCSHAGQLGLGRFLVTFSEALVPLSLGIINHPVASLARIGDRPWDLAERLVQRQIVTYGSLKRVRNVSNPDRIERRNVRHTFHAASVLFLNHSNLPSSAW